MPPWICTAASTTRASASVAAHDRIDCTLRESASGIACDRHVRQHPLQALVFGELAPALRADLHVVDALLNELVHDAAGARRHRYPPRRERLQRLDVAHSFCAEEIFGRHFAVA